MTVQELNKKWESISAPKGGGLYARQTISSSCKPDLMIGKTRDGSRCVLLKLKHKLKFEFQEEEKENLKTYYNNSSSDNDLVLELKDAFFENLFTDLVISLYETIKDLNDDDQATKTFINTVRYWSDFLKSKRSALFSEEIIQGLYGEFVYLEFLLDSLNYPINQILYSWKGPYKASHDFHFPSKNVEVKTKVEGSQIINISSEHQLNAEGGKKLELAVVSIKPTSNNGDNLKLIVDRIRQKIISMGGNTSIFLEAISVFGLNLTSLNEYQNFQFIAKTIEVFECDNPNFPKLIFSELNNSIKDVKYRLILNSIDEKFKIIIHDLK